MRQRDLKSTQFPAIANVVRTSCCVVVLALCVAACQKAPETTSKADAPIRALHRGLGAEPETLNPLLAVDNAALAVVGDLYEGLATEAPDGTIVPGAAREWQVSPDGLSWTFVLRPNLRWSNGDSLVAGHFAAGLRASLAPGAQAPNAALLDNVRSVEVLAPDRLRIDLKRPVPYLPALLALPMASPTHPAADNARTPPSNGPFRLVRWQRGDRIEVERNPYYRSANSVRLDRVTYRLLTDLGTEVNLYRTGELDLTSEVPNAQLPWLREHLPAELKIAPYLSTYAYAVNLRRLPDRDARTALAMAIDRERVTALVTGAGEEPAYGWLPPGVPGYPRQNFSWRDWPAERRMAQARALWRETVARKAAPTALTLCTDASANHHRTAIALADQWQEVLGTHVDIVELEWNVYLATRTAPGDCDLVRLGWSADFADAEAFAAIFESGHPQNTLGYRSANYDALLARSRTTGDAAERARLLSEAERIVLEDVPVIPIFHRVAKRLVKPQVTGYAANPLGHLPSRDLSLDR